MKQETTRRPLIRKVITSKNTENDMTELDENENITIANNNMKKVTSTSVEGDNVLPSFESISKNKFKTSFTQTEVTTHTNKNFCHIHLLHNIIFSTPCIQSLIIHQKLPEENYCQKKYIKGLPNSHTIIIR